MGFLLVQQQPHRLAPWQAGGAQSRGERWLRFLVRKRPPGDLLEERGVPELDQEGWGWVHGGVHAGAAGEGPGRGGGWELGLAVEDHGAYPGGRGLDTGGHVSRQDRQATRQADDEAYRQQGSQGKEESCGEQEMRRAVESSRGEDEKKQVGEEVCV